MGAVVLGNGRIGSAVARIISTLGLFSYNHATPAWSEDAREPVHRYDLGRMTIPEIVVALENVNAEYVINALPFHLNEKVALAASKAGCHYIDFTEDDVAAAKVIRIYEQYPNLKCAVKCGLAPGFINYKGVQLVNDLATAESVTMAVGALPRNVAYDRQLALAYNLSWSVDGLVNEYLRPCEVVENGVVGTKPALSEVKILRIDGAEYEMANTSGGIGSLAKMQPPLANNVEYKSIRYPGTFYWLEAMINRAKGDFEEVKKQLLETTPYNDQDVIITFAEALGKGHTGQYERVAFSENYYGRTIGFKKYSAIQTTTACAGIAMLEMMMANAVKGKTFSNIITHESVQWHIFSTTKAYEAGYA